MSDEYQCLDCGGLRVRRVKLVQLAGQKWYVRKDEYRFYLTPGPNNPLADRNPISCLEFKHNDGPASELADELFDCLLPS